MLLAWDPSVRSTRATAMVDLSGAVLRHHLRRRAVAVARGTTRRNAIRAPFGKLIYAWRGRSSKRHTDDGQRRLCDRRAIPRACRKARTCYRRAASARRPRRGTDPDPNHQFMSETCDERVFLAADSDEFANCEYCGDDDRRAAGLHLPEILGPWSSWPGFKHSGASDR